MLLPHHSKAKRTGNLSATVQNFFKTKGGVKWTDADVNSKGEIVITAYGLMNHPAKYRSESVEINGVQCANERFIVKYNFDTMKATGILHDKTGGGSTIFSDAVQVGTDTNGYFYNIQINRDDDSMFIGDTSSIFKFNMKNTSVISSVEKVTGPRNNNLNLSNTSAASRNVLLLDRNDTNILYYYDNYPAGRTTETGFGASRAIYKINVLEKAEELWAGDSTGANTAGFSLPTSTTSYTPKSRIGSNYFISSCLAVDPYGNIVSLVEGDVYANSTWSTYRSIMVTTGRVRKVQSKTRTMELSWTPSEVNIGGSTRQEECTAMKFHGEAGEKVASKLEVNSKHTEFSGSLTAGSFMLPRYNTEGRDRMSNPEPGMMIFNMTTYKVNVRGNGNWIEL